MSEKITYNFSTGGQDSALDIYYTQLAPYSEDSGDYEVDSEELSNLLSKVNDNESIEADEIKDVLDSCQVTYTTVCGEIMSKSGYGSVSELRWDVSAPDLDLDCYNVKPTVSNDEFESHFGNAHPDQIIGGDSIPFVSPFLHYGVNMKTFLFKTISEEEVKRRFSIVFPNNQNIQKYTVSQLFKKLMTGELFVGMTKEEFFNNSLIKITADIRGGIFEAPDIITQEYLDDNERDLGFGWWYFSDGVYDYDELTENWTHGRNGAVFALFYDLQDPGIYALAIDELWDASVAFSIDSEKKYTEESFSKFKISYGHEISIDSSEPLYPLCSFDNLIYSNFENSVSIQNICVQDDLGDVYLGNGYFDSYEASTYSATLVEITSDYTIKHLCSVNFKNNDVNEDQNHFNAAYLIDYYKKLKEVIDSSTTNASSSNAAPNKSLTKTKSLALNFWTRFNEKIAESGKQLKTRKPNTDTWYDFSIGISKACVQVSLNNREQFVSVGLNISDNKELFDKLEASKKEIERKLQFSLDWDRKDGQKSSSAAVRIFGLDLEDQQKCESIMDQIIDKADVLQKVFKEYVTQN